jgi:hypothetical protein
MVRGWFDLRRESVEQGSTGSMSTNSRLESVIRGSAGWIETSDNGFSKMGLAVDILVSYLWAQTEGRKDTALQSLAGGRCCPCHLQLPNNLQNIESLQPCSSFVSGDVPSSFVQHIRENKGCRLGDEVHAQRPGRPDQYTRPLSHIYKQQRG